jgi:hypothetical protein
MSTDFQFVSVCDKCGSELDLSLFNDDLDICLNCQLDKLKIINNDIQVLSIDIGIKHLAFTVATIDKESYEFIECTWSELIDITVFHCLPNCKLHHDKTFTDWINHVLVKYRQVFEKVNVILIERQPPSGLVVVEQMIFSAYRDKSILISPNSVHKYFSIGSFEYEKRKEYSVKIASKYISEDLIKNYERKHDISDTILFTLFWANKMKEEKKRKELLDKRNNIIKKYNKGLGMSIEDFFHAFRYIPSKSRLDWVD